MKPPAGAVHIWRVDLDAVPDDVERLLDVAERRRASRIIREPARRRWIAARGALRLLLGSCLGEPPGGLRFGSEAHGKPVLDVSWDERLHFSLSHSGGLAVYAMTGLCPVGVDAELIRRSNAPRRRPEQLRAWVRYEAEVKRTGMGIAAGAAQRSEPGGWLCELDVGPDAVAALAASEELEVVLESGAVLERQLGGDLAEARSGAVSL